MKLNKRTTNLLGIGVILILLVLAWLFVVSPSITKQQELNQDLQAAKELTEQYKQQITVLEQVKADIQIYESQDADLSRKFPSNAEIEFLLNDITEAGSKAGVANITQVETETPEMVIPEGGEAAPADPAGEEPAGEEPAPPADDASVDSGGTSDQAPSNDLAIMNLTITAEGSQDSLRQYASNLGQMPRAFLINTTSITCDEGSADSCNTTITGTTYLHRPAPLPTETVTEEQPAAEEQPATEEGQ